MKKPIVSVCCITYNHAPYIRQCLECLLMQKCDFDFEILVHDDASIDGTSEIIREYQKKYPDKIFPIIQDENQWSKGVRGISLRYNFSRAKGKYIAMCEGDDYWTDPQKLQKQVDFLEQNSEYSICYHNAYIIDDKGKLISDSKLPKSCQKDFSSEEMKLGAFILTLSIVMRNVDFSPYISMFTTNGDTILISIIAKYGKGKYMAEIRNAVYRVHSGGVWSQKNQYVKIKSRLETFYSLKKIHPDLGKRLNRKVLKANKEIVSYILRNKDAKSLVNYLFGDLILIKSLFQIIK